MNTNTVLCEAKMRRGGSLLSPLLRAIDLIFPNFCWNRANPANILACGLGQWQWVGGGLILLTLCWDRPLQAAASLEWIAFGDIRGYVEPCGCDPVTDLGGISRIASAIKDQRLRQPRLRVFSLGNNLPGSQLELRKTKALFAFEVAMAADAVLFNRNENQQRDYLLGLKGIKHWPPYVLSTEKGPFPRPSWLATKRITGDAVIYGYASGWEPIETTLSHLGKAVAGDAADKGRVLLFSGTDSALRRLEKTGWFSLILASNQASFDQEPNQDEKQHPGLLLRLDRYYSVPSFGQGLLTSGLVNQSPDLSKWLGTSPQPVRASSIDHLNITPTDDAIIWLTRDFSNAASLKDIMAAYNQAGTHAFTDRAARRVLELPGTTFAGASTCQGCHRGAYLTWKMSHHFGALERLKQQSKHQDGECVNCHVLGYQDRGGYVDQKHTASFAGVQCENCHGAALEHSRMPSRVRPANSEPQKICVTCHKQPHSSAFDFETYWPKIKHGR